MQSYDVDESSGSPPMYQGNCTLEVLVTPINENIIRRGKLNSQFIVTARVDFQIFPKIFRFQIQYSKYIGLGRTLSSALISGRGSGDLELEHIAILVSLIV